MLISDLLKSSLKSSNTKLGGRNFQEKVFIPSFVFLAVQYFDQLRYFAEVGTSASWSAIPLFRK